MEEGETIIQVTTVHSKFSLIFAYFVGGTRGYSDERRAPPPDSRDRERDRERDVARDKERQPQQSPPERRSDSRERREESGSSRRSGEVGSSGSKRLHKDIKREDDDRKRRR